MDDTIGNPPQNPAPSSHWNILGSPGVRLTNEALKRFEEKSALADDLTTMGPASLKLMRLYKIKSEITAGRYPGSQQSLAAEIDDALNDVQIFVSLNPKKTSDNHDNWDEHYTMLDLACGLTVTASKRRLIAIEDMKKLAHTAFSEIKKLPEKHDFYQRTLHFVNEVAAKEYLLTLPKEDAEGPQSHPSPGPGS